MPVTVITGARQSTLVQAARGLASRPYLSLDDLELRDQARRDPASILARGSDLVLDEVQRAPDLLLAVKQAVDQDRPRRPGRYVLTGSANLLLMERVSESLAGRAAYLRLGPLTRRERLGLGRTGIWSELLATSVKDWQGSSRHRTCRRRTGARRRRLGACPVPAHELATAEARALWFDGYVDTYLERDLQYRERVRGGLVLHTAQETFWLAEGILAAPWRRVL
jgi:predicted AAA+ superfamily ATPase